MYAAMQIQLSRSHMTADIASPGEVVRLLLARTLSAETKAIKGQLLPWQAALQATPEEKLASAKA